MKPTRHVHAQGGRRKGRREAFTLPELMISLSLFSVLLLILISVHLFGLRLFEITRAKLSANDDARRALNRLMSEVRSAKIIRIGSGNAQTFTEIPPNTLQEGSAIQINATTNTNTFVRYFLDPSAHRLDRVTDRSAVQPIADYITNTLIFTSEDFAGNILTNNENNRVIGLTLQFYQLEYPLAPIGQGYLFDFYQLHTRITRRMLE